MDLNVDPCNDFYLYSCGNFIRSTNIPDDKTSITTFSKINDDLTEQLRTVIEEPMTPKDPKSFSVAKKLYQACMNKSESTFIPPRITRLLRGEGLRCRAKSNCFLSRKQQKINRGWFSPCCLSPVNGQMGLLF